MLWFDILFSFNQTHRAAMQTRCDQHFPTPPTPCGSWEALTFCPGAQCLTRGLHKCSLIYCT